MFYKYRSKMFSFRQKQTTVAITQETEAVVEGKLIARFPFFAYESRNQ